jgi:phosphohistidine phosphatase
MHTFGMHGLIMQVYIMRHGQAFTSGTDDALRELTAEGQQEASEMAKWISNQNIPIDKVIVSPFVRAQQTFNEIQNSLDKSVVITTLDFITPSGSAQRMHDYIDGICVTENVSHLLIVSHMPLVCYLVAELTTDGDCPLFQTASIAHIDYDTKCMKGQLVSLTSPSDLIE